MIGGTGQDTIRCKSRNVGPRDRPLETGRFDGEEQQQSDREKGSAGRAETV